MAVDQPAAQTSTRSIVPIAVNATAVAFVAALTVQVLHEVCHGIAAILVGGRWAALNLFASNDELGEAAGTWREGLVAGNAAIVNLVLGAVAVVWFARERRPQLRLFVLYAGAYSLLLGFGYLVFDPLFRFEQGEGDWARVLQLLDAGWPLRLLVAAVGAAGVVFAFIWVPRAALRFVADPGSRRDRVRTAAALLLPAYLVVNVVMTVLASWHPLGADGVVAVATQYWLGYFAIFWGFFMTGWWLAAPTAPTTPLPARLSPGWCAAAVVGLVVAVVLATTINFG
jgi:hypothetical protein